MPKKKKRSATKKNKESHVVVVYKFTIYLFLVAILGTLFYKLAMPLVTTTMSVLGVSIGPTQ